MKTYINFISEKLTKSKISDTIKNMYTVKDIIGQFTSSLSIPLRDEYTVMVSGSFDDDIKYNITSWDYEEDTNSCILSINEEGYKLESSPISVRDFINSLNNFPRTAIVFIKDNDNIFSIIDIKKNYKLNQFVLKYKREG